MPVEVIVENGTAMPTANSYVSVADCEAYYASKLALTTAGWPSATDDNKAKAVITATRVIDMMITFKGFQKSPLQALMWPRNFAVNPNRDDLLVPASASTILGILHLNSQYFDADKLPPILVAATCELAGELLKRDRLVDWDGEGIRNLVVKGAVSITFDKTTVQPFIPVYIQNLLSVVGTYRGRNSGVARLTRA